VKAHSRWHIYASRIRLVVYSLFVNMLQDWRWRQNPTFWEIDVDPVISMCNRAIQEVKIHPSSVVSINKTINEHLTAPYNHQDILNLYVSASERTWPPASHYVFSWTSFGTLYVNRQPKNDRGDDLRIKKFAVCTERNDMSPVGFGSLGLRMARKAAQNVEVRCYDCV
jgi:hypothetical protein